MDNDMPLDGPSIIRAAGQSWSDWFWSGAYMPADHEAMAAAAYLERQQAYRGSREASEYWNAICDRLGLPQHKQRVPA